MDYEVGLFIVLFSDVALTRLIHELIGDGYTVGPLMNGQTFDNTGCTVNAYLKVGSSDSFDQADFSDRVMEILGNHGFSSPFHLVLNDPDDCEWCLDYGPMQEIPVAPPQPSAEPPTTTTAWDPLSKASRD